MTQYLESYGTVIVIKKSFALQYMPNLVIQSCNLEAAVREPLALVILVTSKENIGQARFSNTSTTLKIAIGNSKSQKK